MLIDWFTFTAQLINFIVLIWLMKRYLYEPVLKALDERERLIAAQISEAELREMEAEKERDAYQMKNEELDLRRSLLLDEAKADAKAKRTELMDQARRESEGLRERFKKSLTAERQQVQGEIMKRTTREVFAITRKTLSDLANLSLEEQIIEVFIERLNKEEAKGIEKMKAAFGASPQTVTILSSFEISTALQSKIKKSLEELTSAGTKYEFNVSHDLINGIELRSNNYKVSWSIDDYLSTLEGGIMGSMNETNA